MTARSATRRARRLRPSAYSGASVLGGRHGNPQPSAGSVAGGASKPSGRAARSLPTSDGPTSSPCGVSAHRAPRSPGTDPAGVAMPECCNVPSEACTAWLFSATAAPISPISADPPRISSSRRIRLSAGDNNGIQVIVLMPVLSVWSGMERQSSVACAGWRAVTTVVMPPRTSQRVSTVACFGAIELTRSSRIRLVTASWWTGSSR